MLVGGILAFSSVLPLLLYFRSMLAFAQVALMPCGSLLSSRVLPLRCPATTVQISPTCEMCAINMVAVIAQAIVGVRLDACENLLVSALV